MKPAILTVVLLTTASAGNAAIAPHVIRFGRPKTNNEKMGPLRIPHIDRLREQDMNFTDAHSASAVWTPTHYGLLTDRSGITFQEIQLLRNGTSRTARGSE